MNVVNKALRPLRGTNLEVFKFGMYLLFPIGWMYYFGTNLENRFSVEGFWPTQEQSHKIPHEMEDIKAEVERIQRELRRKRDTESRLAQAAEAFRQGDGGGTVSGMGNTAVGAGIAR